MGRSRPLFRRRGPGRLGEDPERRPGWAGAGRRNLEEGRCSHNAGSSDLIAPLAPPSQVKMNPSSPGFRGLPSRTSPWSRPGSLAGFVLVTVVTVLGGCRVEERPADPPPDPGSVPSLPLDTVPLVEPGDRGPEEVAPGLSVGEPFWVGEGTRGAELRAVLPSAAAVDAYLDRREPAVRTPDGRVWSLREILVSVEYPGAGPRAVWRVAGPEEVIDLYLSRIREEGGVGERTPLRELGILPLEVRHCCAEEALRSGLPSE